MQSIKPDKTSEARKRLGLFILSSVLFGVAVGLFTDSLPVLIPASIMPYVLIAAIMAFIILGFVAFKIMLPPLTIKDSIYCYLLYDKQTGQPILLNVNYPFLTNTYHALEELFKTNPNMKTKLQNQQLQSTIFKDLIFYSILSWIGDIVNRTHIFYAMRSDAPRPPKLHYDTKRVHEFNMKEIIAPLNNMFTQVPQLQSMFAMAKLPKGMNISIKEDAVILHNWYVKIHMSFRLGASGLQGHDLRFAQLLKIEPAKNQNIAFQVAFINFEASFNSLTMLFPQSDLYWDYTQELLKNLYLNYDAESLLKDIKDGLIWKKLTT